MQTKNKHNPQLDNSEQEITSGRRVGLGILLACLALISAELLLQVRAQIRSGQSIFAATQGQSKYIYNEELDMRTLRPSAVFEGADLVIRTNRYGLRGEDFEPQAPPGEFRIAQLGASTVQGAFAPTNDDTSSAQLQRYLEETANQSVRVINAGLDGSTLSRQIQLLDKMLSTLDVRVAVWYPGTNDIGCSEPKSQSNYSPKRWSWPGPPKWTLTNRLIVLNTPWIRNSNTASNDRLIKDFDVEQARRNIEEGIQVAKQRRIHLIVVTSANSYRWHMADDEITKRASTALFFRPCFTGRELADSVRAFNEMIRQTAAQYNVALIDAEQLMPTAAEFFGDANHFSAKGEREYAALVGAELLKLELMSREKP